MPEIAGWTVSMHAVERALDMAVEADELRACILTPDYTRPSPPPYDKGSHRLHIRGRLAVAVDGANKRVITVMWYQLWKDGAITRLDDDESMWRDG